MLFSFWLPVPEAQTFDEFQFFKQKPGFIKNSCLFSAIELTQDVFQFASLFPRNPWVYRLTSHVKSRYKRRPRRLDNVHHPPTKSIHPVSVTLLYRCPSPPLIRVHHPLYVPFVFIAPQLEFVTLIVTD